MDQLGISLPWLITQAVNFLVVLFVLQRFAYKPLMGMMEKRKTEIANALANAEKVRQDAAAQRTEFEKQLEAARREGQEAIQRATAQSEKVRIEIVAQANAEAEAIRAKARADADYERKQALVAAQQQIAELSISITRKVLSGGAINETTHRQLVQRFLSDVEKA